jgi:RsiW-degrading membrane proteinase PrsW (M82 family)
MSVELLIEVPVGLLPVLIFLFTLRFLDSYKLVSLRTVLQVIAAGAVTAVAAYYLNGWLLDRLAIDFRDFSRYVSPFTEEALKAAIVIMLLRTHRIGFLVDGAIMGFAVGAGFAVTENLYYLYTGGQAHVGVWIVRGFGTAIMHGGVTAIFALLSHTLSERNMRINPVFYLPGFLGAATLHSLFNHFVLPPVLMTAGVLAILPPLLFLVFQRSAARLHDWLELDFDADAGLLAQINSGDFAATKAGRFLHDLRSRFDGPVVVDMLCYLRLYTELALRAKGLLLMREHGLEAPVGERTREKFIELAFLERSIGRTGVLAMRPFLHITRKDLWQLNLLDD